MKNSKYIISTIFILGAAFMLFNKTELSASNALPFQLGVEIDMNHQGTYSRLSIDEQSNEQHFILFTPNEMDRFNYSDDHYIIGYTIGDSMPINMIMTSTKMDSIYECEASIQKITDSILKESDETFKIMPDTSNYEIMLRNSAEKVYASCKKSNEHVGYFNRNVLYESY